MSNDGLVPPHGGQLVNRITEHAAPGLYDGPEPAITLSERQQCDLEMIAIGAFSPLTGFVGQDRHRPLASGP